MAELNHASIVVPWRSDLLNRKGLRSGSHASGIAAEDFLSQSRIAIFLYLDDFTVLQSINQAVLVIVGDTGLGFHLSRPLNHHIIAFRDDIVRDRSSTVGQKGREITIEIAKQRLLAFEGLRPRIVTGD